MTVCACGMLMVDCNFTLLIFYLLMTNFFWHDVKKAGVYILISELFLIFVASYVFVHDIWGRDWNQFIE